MIKACCKLFLLFIFASGALITTAQPFADDIALFKKQDSVLSPPVKAILFVGSSSFTRWNDLQDYFPGYTIINRGFGGSSLTDVIRYATDIILPYQPKQIIIYCGENDLAGSDTVTAKHVLQRFKKLFYLIRQKLSRVSVVYISIKPSPSRKHLLEKFKESNLLIKNFLEEKDKTDFIDVYSKMIDAKGNPIENLFVEDQLHMNKSGYLIWQKTITPVLLK